MSRAEQIDLAEKDDAALRAELERVDAELRRRRQSRESDAERFDLCSAAIDRLGVEDAATLRRELSEVSPSAFLDAHWVDLTPEPDRPALGAYLALRGEHEPEFTHEGISDFPTRWLRADPLRLGDVVESALELTPNLRRVVECAFGVAALAGIDEPTAERIILAALKERSKGASDAG